uniref:Uncharacterized protein n=1 Tax=Avena sativa TaxID=4498 RepID=A0ACD5WC03_AVESA
MGALSRVSVQEIAGIRFLARQLHLEIAMDDSRVFMEWAMDTLHHDLQPWAAAYAGGSGDNFPTLQELHCSVLQNSRAPEQTVALDGLQHRVTSSWSSGDSGGRDNTPAAVVEKAAWSSNTVNCPPSCSVDSTNWNLSAALAQPSIDETTPSPTTAPARAHDGHRVPELAYASAPSRKGAAKSAASTGHASPEPCVQDHVMAERNRREKINRRFIELSAVIPGLKRMDKATILSDAVRYVKEQQEKLKALEEDRDARTIESTTVLVRKPSTAAGSRRSVLPEIDARISESNVLVRIYCEDGKGVLVRLLSEIEGLHLSIRNTNVMPFQACTVIITIMAKVNEGFNITAEDIVAKLGSALHPCHSEN